MSGDSSREKRLTGSLALRTPPPRIYFQTGNPPARTYFQTWTPPPRTCFPTRTPPAGIYSPTEYHLLGPTARPELHLLGPTSRGSGDWQASQDAPCVLGTQHVLTTGPLHWPSPLPFPNFLTSSSVHLPAVPQPCIETPTTWPWSGDPLSATCFPFYKSNLFAHPPLIQKSCQAGIYAWLILYNIPSTWYRVGIHMLMF